MAKAFVLAALLALACTQVSASSISANVNNNQTGTWMDLFQPPYNSGPNIMMSISCTTRWTCYVPGGSNGVGFQMYLFPGVPNGQFTTLKMPNPPMMMMAIALGGTTSNPGGAVAGIGLGNGIQYPVDNVTFMPSTTSEFLAPSQDVRASANGQDVLVINAGPNAVQYSSNGGKNFTVKPINVPLAVNCTSSRYGAMIDANTWYVSMGSWPKSNDDESQFHLSQGETFSRCPKTGKVSRHVRNPFKTEDADAVSGKGCTSFSAMIVKTTDGGNTWTTQFSQATNFYFNAIDCLNATNCVVVGEGSGSGAGVHIYRTVDGQTWNQVYYKPYTSTQHYSLMTIRANNGRYFVGGGMQTQTSAGSLILTSDDQGLTWVEENSVPNVAAISSFSFTPSGYGFATGITIYQSSTILRYDPTAPGPSPPQPPTPTIKMFIQEQCSDAACTVGCQNHSFPSGQCLPTSSGSALVTCGATTLDQQSFTTTDCSGPSTSSTMPLNQCLKSTTGNYFENICPTSMNMAGRVQNGKKLLVTRRA